MNATERKALTAMLQAGDIPAALAYLAAPKPSPCALAAPKPAKRRGRLNKFAPPPTLLGVAPCGCTCWLDQAVLCTAHEAARDESACLALIESHAATIAAHELRLFGSPGVSRPRNWRAFIFQAACRYQHCA